MHLSSYQINRYRHAGLAAQELLVIDDHLLTCEFCRQQLRAGINLQAAIHQLQATLLRLPEEEHLSPEQCDAFAHNRLDAIERELVASHLLSCPSCTAQIQTVRENHRDTIPPIAQTWASVTVFLQERAASIWPMPVAALVVMLAVIIADCLYLRQGAKPVAPKVTKLKSIPASPAPISPP